MKTIAIAIAAAFLIATHIGIAQADTRTTLGALYPGANGQASRRLSALPRKPAPQVTLKCRSAACLMQHPRGVTIARPGTR